MTPERNCHVFSKIIAEANEKDSRAKKSYGTYLRSPGPTCARPWSRAASGALCHRWTSGRSASYGPFFHFLSCFACCFSERLRFGRLFVVVPTLPQEDRSLCPKAVACARLSIYGAVWRRRTLGKVHTFEGVAQGTYIPRRRRRRSKQSKKAVHSKRSRDSSSSTKHKNMSGRGKGGKGLGKGGAKRHRKVLRDNIQGTLSF